jgi:hypothetical protein
MQIEEGKYYMTRDGRKVGPVYLRGGEWVSDNRIGDFFPMWHIKNGVANFWSVGDRSDMPEYDIIAEWPAEETPAVDANPSAPYTSYDAWRDIHTALGDAVNVALSNCDYDKAMEYAGLMRAIEQEGFVSPSNATE